MVVLIADAFSSLEAFALETKSETGFYPQTATLVPVSLAPSSTVRLRLAAPKDARHFDTVGEEYRVERNPNHTGVFPPGVVVALGDRLTLLTPLETSGQVFEVTEPVKPDPLGYTAGLAFVQGTR